MHANNDSRVDHSLAPDSQFNPVPIGYRVPPTTASTESLLWAKELLRDCDDSHENCPRAISSDVSLPTRVLDISTEVVRLFHTQGKAGRYVALSHCWGLRAQTLPRTRSFNIRLHEEGISLDRLSAKFRDAIAFVRSLGIRYIWIDSLCIVQDDEEDWRREGSRMASIYSNAYLVIAAAARSTETDPGMFSPVDSAFDAHDLDPQDGETTGIFARRALAHIPRNKGRTGWQRSVVKIPEELDLLRRGWVFQERYLSPRVLFFGPEELSWECAGFRACQCSGKSVHSMPIDNSSSASDNDDFEWHYNTKRYYSASALRQILTTGGGAQVARRWLRCVQEYTNLLLTFDKDIFPALSGLARVFGQVLDSRYVAGIWEDFVHLGLVWHVNAWNERPKQWRAPTWSWASAKGPVTTIMKGLSEGLSPTAEVVDISSTPVGSDAYGEISGAHIVLKGPVIFTKVRHKEYKGEARYRHEHAVGLDFLDGKAGRVYSDYDVVADGPRQLSPGADVACLFVCQGGDPKDCFFLVLRSVQGADSYRTFERIGLLVLFGGNKDGKDFDPKKEYGLAGAEHMTIKIR